MYVMLRFLRAHSYRCSPFEFFILQGYLFFLFSGFIQSGFIEVIRYASDTTIYRLAYEYNVNLNNVNALNIQTFSKNADDEMLNCDKCPKETFKKFDDYYGIPDYGDNLILAAFQGGQTDFRHGNIDFSEAPRASRGGKSKQIALCSL
jgi:hypothetical protein